MNESDIILKKLGLEFEDLTEDELEVYRKLNKNAKVRTMKDLENWLSEMILNITLQLCNTPDTKENYEKNRVFKARLKNFLFLQVYITAPEKALKAIEKQAEVI